MFRLKIGLIQIILLLKLYLLLTLSTMWMSLGELFTVAWLATASESLLLPCIQVMIETLRPEETLREVSVRADLPQILFRKLRQEYIDMGYGYRHQSYDHSE